VSTTEYRIVARNTAVDHTESIHDDGQARQFGYAGGLVPGIVIYGYMTHILAERWGDEWIQRGFMSSRSVRPAYEGESLVIAATDGDDGLVHFDARKEGAEKPVAIGAGSLGGPVGEVPPADSMRIFPMPEEPPLASVGAIPVGHEMGTRTTELTREMLEEYVDSLDETYAAYKRRGIFPPSYLQEATTHIERANFVYETPTIYVASTAQTFREIRVGDVLECPGKVTGFFEKNGNHYVEVEMLVISKGEVIARVTRESIYRARDSR
jgi:hypothetical protein